MEPVFVIGLDLGGTAIKGLLLRDDGTIVQRKHHPSGIEAGPERVLDVLAETARELCRESGITPTAVVGVGVGSPGPLDAANGRILRSANLSGFENVPIRDGLAARLDRPVELLNDGSAATYGEYWCGAGERVPWMVMLTLGTGVGGGIICDGHLVGGVDGNAGELGHLIVHPGGRPCNCGQRGCLEAYAGGVAVVRAATALAHHQPGPLRTRLEQHGVLDVPDVIAAASTGDSAAGALWAEVCSTIAVACVTLQRVLSPQRIILGGGVAAAGPALLIPVQRAFAELQWTMGGAVAGLALATTGNDAGALGAAGWLLHRHARG